MKRIAIFVVGGLDDSNSGNHVPTLYGCVAKLSGRYDITAYSQSRIGIEAHVGKCGNAFVKHLPVDRSTNPISRGHAFLSEFIRDHARKPFHVVHAFWGLPCGLYALSAARMKHLDVILSLMGGETADLPHVEYGRLRSFPEREIMMWVLKNTPLLVTQSEFQAGELSKLGIKKKSISVIPHGVERKNFRVHKKRRITPPYRFLHVGTLNEVKDQVSLLLAFSKISKHADATLRILGEGHLENSLRSLANDMNMGDRIEFLGFVPSSQTAVHYQWADILLQASLHEGGGATVLEAMTYGVLVCGTRVGFLSDFENKIALAVDVGDYQSLADKALSLIYDRPRQRLFRQRGRQWSSAHDVDWTARKYSDLYDTQCQIQ